MINALPPAPPAVPADISEADWLLEHRNSTRRTLQLSEAQISNSLEDGSRHYVIRDAQEARAVAAETRAQIMHHAAILQANAQLAHTLACTNEIGEQKNARLLELVIRRIDDRTASTAADIPKAVKEVLDAQAELKAEIQRRTGGLFTPPPAPAPAPGGAP